MKLAGRTGTLALLALLALPQSAAAERIVVGFERGADPAARERALAGLDRAGSVPQLGAVIVDVPDHAAARVRAALERRSSVRYVVDDVRMSASWTPNDPRLGSQWGLTRIGATQAWDSSRGAGVLIAVVDSGVDYGHPDLQGKVVKGRDFVAGDADPFDENGHGTHVAGIAAATTNNGVGVAGTAPDASVLAVRVLDASGSGYMSWIANGIVHSADQGAKVINLSLGGASGTTTLRDAIVYARGKGAVVTCATGNDSRSSLSYPAAYAECLSVGASDSNDARASFSNYGTGIDLVAPGTSILSSVLGSSYSSWNGTSMATPFVSGAAALLASRGLSGSEIERALTSSALDLGPSGYDTTFGHGRLQAAAALATIAPVVSEPAPAPVVEPAPAPVEETAPAPTQPVNQAPTCTSSSVNVYGATSIRLSCTDAEGSPLVLSIVAAPTKGSLSSINQSTGTVTYTPKPKAKGTDAFTFRASDGSLVSADAKVSLAIKSTTSTATAKSTCGPKAGAAGCAATRTARR